MMKFSAYWFKHDSNAKDDPKIVLLIEQLGLEGYGIYWMLIETLRDQDNYKYPLRLIPALARRYNTSTEKIAAVINTYGLFATDEETFYSESLITRMKEFDHRREVAIKAGQKSAETRLLNRDSTTVQQPVNNRSTSVQQPFDNRSTTAQRPLNGCSTSVQRPFNDKSRVDKSIYKKEIYKEKSNFTLPEYINPDTWAAFCEMRHKSKQPPTDKAIQLILARLDSLRAAGDDPNAVLEQSIINNWRGVFPLKDKPIKPKDPIYGNWEPTL